MLNIPQALEPALHWGAQDIVLEVYNVIAQGEAGSYPCRCLLLSRRAVDLNTLSSAPVTVTGTRATRTSHHRSWGVVSPASNIEIKSLRTTDRYGQPVDLIIQA